MLASSFFLLGSPSARMPMKDQLSILLYKAKLFAFSESKGKPQASRILAHDDCDQNENILSSQTRHIYLMEMLRGARVGCGWALIPWTRPVNSPFLPDGVYKTRLYFHSRARNKLCLQKSGFSNFRVVNM